MCRDHDVLSLSDCARSLVCGADAHCERRLMPRLTARGKEMLENSCRGHLLKNKGIAEIWGQGPSARGFQGDACGDSRAKTLDTPTCSKNYTRMSQELITCGAVLTGIGLRITLACGKVVGKTVASRPLLLKQQQPTTRSS